MKGAKCLLCGKGLDGIASCIGICPSCVRNRPEESRGRIEQVHAESREMFGLPVRPAANPEGIECKLCFLRCRPGKNQKGYCGVRHGSKSSMRTDGRIARSCLLLLRSSPYQLRCRLGLRRRHRAGYPRFAHDCGPEVGFYNLAVFFEACNLNCLYCQNWSLRKAHLSPRWSKIETLEKAVNDTTSCICFFGGDPGPQLPYARSRQPGAAKEKP